ncbi:hypothetical protein QYF36_012491 [Acer negundo]|nr:hypothetical protein QYF36_012491 [Acer negundo]
MTVRAFENSVRQTVGVIELDVVTGPYQFKISLNVVDIEASFTFGNTLAPFRRALPHKAHLRCTKGLGLGISLQGRLVPVILPRHDPPFLYLVGLERLDYKPTPQDYVKRAERRRQIGKARRNGEPDPAYSRFCSKVFPFISYARWPCYVCPLQSRPDSREQVRWLLVRLFTFLIRHDNNSNSTSILSREGTEIPRKRRLPVANRIDLGSKIQL